MSHSSINGKPYAAARPGGFGPLFFTPTISSSTPAATLRGRSGRLVGRARSLDLGPGLRLRSIASVAPGARSGARPRCAPPSPCSAERARPTEAQSPRPLPRSWPTSGLGPWSGSRRGHATDRPSRCARRRLAPTNDGRRLTVRRSLPSRRSSPAALAHQVGSAAHSQARQRQPALALLGRLTLATESPPRASFSHPVTSNPASTAPPFPSPGFAGSVTPVPSMCLPATKPLAGSRVRGSKHVEVRSNNCRTC